MEKKLTARERFRAVFEHNTAELDRLPMLSLGTPAQGLFYQNWNTQIAESDAIDEYVRLTYFGDKTMHKWLTSEWHNISLGWPHNYPHVPLPENHYEWDRFTPEERKTIKMSIGHIGGISASGKQMHGVDYGWYVNGFFTRQKLPSGDVLEPWEVRDKFYAEHGEQIGRAHV